MQVFGIDWSGDRDGGRSKIWMAESRHGHLRDLTNGRSRDEVADYLISLAQEDPNLVVGFDFVFSMPAWYVEEQGAGSGPEFWELVEEQQERWLTDCPWPFFARKGKQRPDDVELFRRTELEVPAVSGRRPKSVFQLGGAGHPGTASIRGMPILKRLNDEGFRIWPFQQPEQNTPLVVEIYPRLLTGKAVKTNRAERIATLGKLGHRISHDLRDIAARDEDEFDAAVSAAVMNRYLHELVALPAGDELERLEGRIWYPRDDSFVAGEKFADYLDPEIPDEPFILVFPDLEVDDGPFDPKLAQRMEWEEIGPDGTWGLATGGTPRYLRVVKRDDDRLFTADGFWIRLTPLPALK